jgi:preprotein translocase subunit SecG
MAILYALVMVLLLFLAFFLIVLVLIQRGKGGGLAGALGGMGGQSAFGTKAGDLFTKITVGVAAVWIVLCIASVKLYSTAEGRLRLGSDATEEEESTVPGTSGGGATSEDSAPAGSAAGTSPSRESASSGAEAPADAGQTPNK